MDSKNLFWPTKKIKVRVSYSYGTLIVNSYRPNKNEVILRGQTISLRYCQPLKHLIYFAKGFGSFPTGNVGSIGQRATKVVI